MWILRGAYADPPLFEAVMVWFVTPTWSDIPDIEPSLPSISPVGRGGVQAHLSGSPPEKDGDSMWHDSPLIQSNSDDFKSRDITGIGSTDFSFLKDDIPA